MSTSLFIRETGAMVCPGDLLYSAPLTVDGEALQVVAGEGSYVKAVSGGDGTEELVLLSSKLGIVQWDESCVSVFSRAAPGSLSTASSHTVLGPRPGDYVHVRILRVQRMFAYGEIIAINNTWCSHRRGFGAFRGVLRQDDIRTFHVTKDQLTPPPPSVSFSSGDVVLAEVVSQSDVRQYQLSTVGPQFGVLESTIVREDGSLEKLQHIPQRRDAMVSLSDGALHLKWCPLL
ncbi:exosome complex component CSL4 [Angomonas deanei]|uniref:Uncharacterized protein n=1 Tax=Angomonas deanei TaxID=59799 RepID=S9VPY1_9TRYP|nr:exosome complex component CSL4 [Angomonas deanei]EPY42914.1 exosome complex component CSL4 [Angomonas deanei]CAD2220811.1 hypothetical protein, conserved [Angomonas deanei]|eukprot:EPY40261.1 exosome complex component CSL4 [Angomonas deanei]